MLADGHALVEGAPGLAKTKLSRPFRNVLPPDITVFSLRRICCRRILPGVRFYVRPRGEFEFRRADFCQFDFGRDDNRAPAKVQSGALGATAERQVSVGGSHLSPELFMVMATQNPIEHEGTYNRRKHSLTGFDVY